MLLLKSFRPYVQNKLVTTGKSETKSTHVKARHTITCRAHEQLCRLLFRYGFWDNGSRRKGEKSHITNTNSKDEDVTSNVNKQTWMERMLSSALPIAQLTDFDWASVLVAVIAGKPFCNQHCSFPTASETREVEGEGRRVTHLPPGSSVWNRYQDTLSFSATQTQPKQISAVVVAVVNVIFVVVVIIIVVLMLLM